MKYIKPDKVFYHPERVDNLLRHGQSAPITAEIHLSNRCNNNCFYCGQKNNHDNQDMSLELINHLNSFLKNTGIKGAYFSGGGESTLSKNLFHAFDSIPENIDLGMITNGIIMSDTLIDWYLNRFTWVRISIDTGDKETYKKIRGTDSFEKAICNIKKLTDKKNKINSKTTIGLQIVVNEHNYMNLESHVVMLLNLLPDIDYIQVRPIESLINENPYEKFNMELLNSQLIFSNKPKVIVSNKWSSIYFRKFQFSKCHATDFIYTIDVHGDVYTCCHVIGNENYKICNISDSGYFESREDFLSKVKNKGFDPKVCFYNCRGSAINKNIEDMIKEEHKNFL